MLKFRLNSKTNAITLQSQLVVNSGIKKCYVNVQDDIHSCCHGPWSWSCSHDQAVNSIAIRGIHKVLKGKVRVQERETYMLGRKIALTSHDAIDKFMCARAHIDLAMQLRLPTHAASLVFIR